MVLIKLLILNLGGNVAKVKIEIDLLKPKQDSIWLGFNKLDVSEDGKWLEIKYEGAPTYCHYFKLQGHGWKQYRNKKIDIASKMKIKEATEKENKSDRGNNKSDSCDNNQQDKDSFQEVNRRKSYRRNK